MHKYLLIALSISSHLHSVDEKTPLLSDIKKLQSEAAYLSDDAFENKKVEF